MKEVTEVILDYRDFLNLNLERLISILENAKDIDDFQKGDLIEDWLQVNWEIYVESIICKVGEFLEVYASGSECNIESARVRYPNHNATHTIKCFAVASNGLVQDCSSNEMINPNEMDFHKFIGMDDVFYYDSGSFDFVLLEDSKGEFYPVNINSVKFVLLPLSGD